MTTLLLAMWMVGMYYTVTRRRKVRSTLRAARPWERVAIVVLMFLPLPGPLDELGVAAIMARVARREGLVR